MNPPGRAPVSVVDDATIEAFDATIQRTTSASSYRSRDAADADAATPAQTTHGPSASQPQRARRGGCMAEAPRNRVARVLANRQDLVQQILARVTKEPSTKVWEGLSPLEQLLPSPAGVAHSPTGAAMAYTDALILHRECLSNLDAHSTTAGYRPERAYGAPVLSLCTELQQLCVMVGLPVLS